MFLRASRHPSSPQRLQGGARPASPQPQPARPSLGNQALQYLLRSGAVQAKLTVNQPGDRWEREADEIAERVLEMPEPGLPGEAAPASPASGPAPGGGVQRKCAAEEATEGAEVQRKEAAGSSGTAAVESDGSALTRGGSAGRPLEGSLRSLFEPRFRRDFSNVRVHTGLHAEGMARALQARAFTFGAHVFFGAGFYDPDSRTGRRLLAHELAHVVQQRRAARQFVQRQALSQALSAYNDRDPNHDPSRLSDAQIQTTEEYRLLINLSFPPLPQQFVTPEEALLACRLMLRHMREGGTVNRATDGDIYINRAKRQLGTLRATGALETHLNWVPFNTSAAVSNPAALPTEFGRWVLAGGSQPSGLSGQVNCWEMILLGAFQGGFITFARIQQIYQRAVDNVRNGRASLVGDTVEAELRAGAHENVFNAINPSTPEPLPGDIVIFNTAATHTVISLGTKTATGEHNVLSLWNRPNNNFHTQRTTIEALRAAGSPGPVKFWSPAW